MSNISNGSSKGQRSTRSAYRKKPVYKTAVTPVSSKTNDLTKQDTPSENLTVEILSTNPLTDSQIQTLLHTSTQSTHTSDTDNASTSTSPSSTSSVPNTPPPTVTTPSPTPTSTPTAAPLVTDSQPPSHEKDPSIPDQHMDEEYPLKLIQPLQIYASTSDNDGFTVVKGKKSAPAKPATKTTTTPTQTSNSFTPLNKDKDLPPPIILNSKDYNPTHITEHLKLHNITNFTVQHNKPTTRIFPKDDDTHSKILKLFQHPKNNVQVHTFAPRGTKRNLTYLITGLDKFFPIQSVEEALNCDEFVSARRLTKTDKDGVKRYIEPILVTFTPEYNAKENLFKIKDIDHIRVRIKRHDPEEQIPQCFRCQQYGHTKGYCSRPPKCVRCAGAHDSKECSKNNKLQCANCGGDHPASWRGCSHHQNILKNIQARKNPEQAPQFIPAPQPTHNAWTARKPPSNTLFPPLPQQPSPTPLLPTPEPPSASNPPLFSQPPVDPYATPPWVNELRTMITNLVSIVNNLLDFVKMSITK